ncbi:MAG: hypoxanthine phosphoribosyltransferase [Acidimicrobiales bacterium]|nr:hypoxanthine phosphoribosyltransferase [Acidimicrobiales bacterium]
MTDLSPTDDPALTEILVTRDEIKARVQGLGQEISNDYAGRVPLLIGVLKGGVIFASDLARAINLPVELDFMAVSSYGSTTRNSGVVRIIKDLDNDIEGRDVIIVEDIVDSGLTLRYLRKTLLARNPASLEFCSLLVREEQQADLDDLVKYAGFRLPQVWVVGYGLDVGQRYRNLGDIWAYDTSVEQ